MSYIPPKNPLRRKLENFLSRCSSRELHHEFSEPWLNEILPGLSKTINCSQGQLSHLEGDVARHVVLVFENLKKTAATRLEREPDFIERLAVLVHDLKKPECAVSTPEGGVNFPGHEMKAAQEVPAISKKLDLSRDEEDRLYFMVAYHGETHGFPKLSSSRQEELKRSPWIESLALIHEADALSCHLKGGGNKESYWNKLRS